MAKNFCIHNETADEETIRAACNRLAAAFNGQVKDDRVPGTVLMEFPEGVGVNALRDELERAFSAVPDWHIDSQVHSSRPEQVSAPHVDVKIPSRWHRP